MNMLYGKYKFICCFENNAILPGFKGSTFRGVFGRALKKVVCALKRQECKQCLLNKSCIYALVFETSLAIEPKEDSRISEPPHPFVIEPPLTNMTEFNKGDLFECSLTLFGDVNNGFPYFVYAFDQMGKTGLGRRVNGKRGAFSLKEILGGKRLVYSGNDKKLNLSDSVDVLKIPHIDRRGNGKFRIRVKLETPFRLKFEKRIMSDLPFHVFTRAMLRRVSSLLEYYGGGEPELDYRGLVERARDIRIVDSHIEWFDWERYSFRQKLRMPMGGMVGSIIYEGELDEYIPLLEFCSKVNLGKNTSFGLGKVTINKV